MRVDPAAFLSRVAKGIDGIEEEAAEFAEGSPEHCAVMRELCCDSCFDHREKMEITIHQLQLKVWA
jgi:hypothetical protein